MKIKFIHDKHGVACERTGIWRPGDAPKELSKKDANFLLQHYPNWFQIITEPAKIKQEKKPLKLDTSKTK